MLSRILIIILAIAGVGLAAIMGTTSPSSAGAAGILAVFVLGYVIILCLTTFLLHAISRIIARVMRGFVTHKTADQLSLKKAYYYATVLALAPIMIISLQSVGGIGTYELFLVGLLEGIGCIYVSKRAI